MPTRTAIVFIKDCPPKAKAGDISYIYVGEPSPEDFALEWKNPEYTVHMVIPTGLDHRALAAVVGVDGSVELTSSPEKIASIKAAGKAAQAAEAYQRMDKDVFDRMETIFGTRRPDSAAAFSETWQLMVNKPQLFAGVSGVIADKAVAGLVRGQPLTTQTQVLAFANARIAEAEAYAVWRLQRIVQFQMERAAIMAAP